MTPTGIGIYYMRSEKAPMNKDLTTPTDKVDRKKRQQRTCSLMLTASIIFIEVTN
jgi:hypothetical protein